MVVVVVVDVEPCDSGGESMLWTIQIETGLHQGNSVENNTTQHSAAQCSKSHELSDIPMSLVHIMRSCPLPSIPSLAGPMPNYLSCAFQISICICGEGSRNSTIAAVGHEKATLSSTRQQTHRHPTYLHTHPQTHPSLLDNPGSNFSAAIFPSFSSSPSQLIQFAVVGSADP